MYTFEITKTYSEKVLKCFDLLKCLDQYISFDGESGVYYSNSRNIYIQKKTHSDGDIEHIVYYGSERIFVTYTMCGSNDDNFADYDYDTREGYDYDYNIITIIYASLGNSNKLDFIYESSWQEYTVYDILKIEEMDEAMYEQLQFANPPEVVHCQYIVSAMTHAGISGLFHQNPRYDIDSLIIELENAYDQERRI